MRLPETRYVRSGGASLAYQVLGMGALDLVLVPGPFSHLEIQWEDPGFGQLVKRLSAFARLILFDPRGTGVSDRGTAGGWSLDRAADDIRAMLDAAGSGKVSLLGAFDGATTARHFATRFPARTRSLLLYAPATATAIATLSRTAEKSWGRGDTAALLAPEQANDTRFRAWWSRFERLAASPTEAAALLQRAAGLGPAQSPPAVPTIVIRRAGDILVPELRGTPAGAQIVELPGRDHLLWSGDVNRLADVVEEFLTGAAPVPVNSRVLAALLVARIVSPERLMLRFGEDRWQDRLERLAAAGAEIITRHAGQAAPGDPISIRVRFDSPVAAIRAAVDLREAARALDLPLSTGLSVGEVDREQTLPSGRAFFITEGVARQAVSGEILASRVIADLCGNLGQSFIDHDPLTLEGLSGPTHVVTVISPNPLEPLEKPVHEPELDRLSTREREVLKLVAEGLSNAAIAGALRLSEHTVKRHVANILMKLDLPTRAAAATLADKLPA